MLNLNKTVTLKDLFQRLSSLTEEQLLEELTYTEEGCSAIKELQASKKPVNHEIKLELDEYFKKYKMLNQQLSKYSNRYVHVPVNKFNISRDSILVGLAIHGEDHCPYKNKYLHEPLPIAEAIKRLIDLESKGFKYVDTTVETREWDNGCNECITEEISVIIAYDYREETDEELLKRIKDYDSRKKERKRVYEELKKEFESDQ